MNNTIETEEATSTFRLGTIITPAFPVCPRVTGRAMLAAIVTVLVFTGRDVCGQALTDPGFESYAVSSGGFVKPSSGPWLFNNDAGVVEPISPNSSLGSLNTWSATFAAPEGEQYASTYAGADFIKQMVSFGTAGNFTISVYAAAPDGTVTFPSQAPKVLEDGQFDFTLQGSAVGSVQTVPKGSNWNLYTATFNIVSPGTYEVGILNTKSAPYFINYDAFAIQPVPEPATLRLVLISVPVIAWAGVVRHRGR